MPTRWTNLALLWIVPLAALSGFAMFLVGSGPVLLVALVHGVIALLVVVLTPWKSMIVRRTMRRAPRPGRTVAVALGVVVVLALVTGVLHVLGILADRLPLTVLQVHVGAGIVAAILTLAHARDRRIRARRGDLSRRALLRAGLLTSAAGVLEIGVVGAGALANPPGTRRDTGSHRLASDSVDAIPATSWLFDSVPTVDATAWRVTVAADGTSRAWGLADLAAYGDEVTTVLDCTGGWWTRKTWRGVRVSRLLPAGATGSILVTSVTGYRRRLPLSDDLLLATSLAGEPLRVGHGAPARLVVPGRRGYHWVKWVERIELSDLPWWAQLPFSPR
ncbi:molybdopterin-dependent oxidoreductase [Lapillicoccus sp.]|uniref:molybdopterin-dependent oxidoreductase n=1 Tax=Lapillicoccus sp. TaxID=1909287 RepID=UPI0025F094B9|nr:molybdopterin-dependent oxidoreductase [Lapillicoccus sp.]